MKLISAEHCPFPLLMMENYIALKYLVSPSVIIVSGIKQLQRKEKKMVSLSRLIGVE